MGRAGAGRATYPTSPRGVCPNCAILTVPTPSHPRPLPGTRFGELVQRAVLSRTTLLGPRADWTELWYSDYGRGTSAERCARARHTASGGASSPARHLPAGPPRAAERARSRPPSAPPRSRPPHARARASTGRRGPPLPGTTHAPHFPFSLAAVSRRRAWTIAPCSAMPPPVAAARRT